MKSKVIFLFAFLQCVHSAKILGVFSTPSKSHMLIHTSLMKQLAINGHEVTVASSFGSSHPIPLNYRDLIISVDNEDFEQNIIFPKFIKDAETGQASKSNLINYIMSLSKRSEDSLNHPEMLKLRNETFDLLIIGYFFNDFQLGLAAHFKCPIIVISTLKASGVLRSFTGNPNGIPYVPSSFIVQKDLLKFWNRLVNFLAAVAEHIALYATDYFIYEPYYERNFPKDQYPPLSEVRKNISLVLTNHYFTQGIVEPLFPSMVDVGGMHISSHGTQPLSKDILEFLDSAKDGAIFFSLGTNVRSSDLSIEKRNQIVRVFSKLKEKILWKWETDNLDNKPDNVMISKWFPQNAILAHRNTKLFISHCGLSSIYEAKYYGIPILGIPIFVDQPANVQIIESEGWAISIKLPELNETTFSEKLQQILTNNSYSNRIKQLSVLYRDRPQHPLDTAIYWVEYVLRYGGAKHMQSSAVHLNFVQYHSLDVIAFMLASVYILCKIFSFIFLKIWIKLRTKIKHE